MKIAISKIFPLLILVICSLYSCTPKANTAVTTTADNLQEGQVISLRGRLIRKPWTKSMQSYCAQGSAYVVLKEGEREHVLEMTELQWDNLREDVGKVIKIRGMFVTKVIPSPGNDMQHPVSSPNEQNDGDVTCTVFKVTNTGY